MVFDLIEQRLREEAHDLRLSCPPIKVVELIALDPKGFPRNGWTLEAIKAHMEVCGDCVQFYAQFCDHADEDGHPTTGLVEEAEHRIIRRAIDVVAAVACPDCGNQHPSESISFRIAFVDRPLGLAVHLTMPCNFTRIVTPLAQAPA